jgi:hypothetical protein
MRAGSQWTVILTFITIKIFGPPLLSISQDLTNMTILDEFLAPMRVS